MVEKSKIQLGWKVVAVEVYVRDTLRITYIIIDREAFFFIGFWGHVTEAG